MMLCFKYDGKVQPLLNIRKSFSSEYFMCFPKLYFLKRIMDNLYDCQEKTMIPPLFPIQRVVKMSLFYLLLISNFPRYIDIFF